MNNSKSDYKIYYRYQKVKDDFTGQLISLDGWSHTNYSVGPVGVFSSYTAALAHAMGLWEEYCEYHRTKGG